MEQNNKSDAIQWYAQNRGLYKKLSQKIHNILLELLEEANITIHTITNRTKEINSLKQKINNPKYDDPIEQITDFSGIRIIAYVEDDLKPISKIIEETFLIDVTNSSDKSDELGTDKVGYKSIHYIAKIKDDRAALTEYRKFKDLKFEIQIRTILQHAWAEIEHDRNYKFNGVLPAEIKRRFKILAGTLELVDREFNLISREIDKIAQSVIIADKENELKSISINSTTLKEFLSTRFENLINDGFISPTLAVDLVILDELKAFGIKTLQDLDNIITPDFIKTYSKVIKKVRTTNFLGLLRDIMITNDYKKYFSKAWNHSWSAIDPDTTTIFSAFKISTQEILDTYINPE